MVSLMFTHIFSHFWPWQTSCFYTFEKMMLPSSQANGKRILVVEDELSIRELVKSVLACDGHTVVEANNGVEGLSAFRKEPFDLVIVDLGIPFMQGDELAVRIKQLSPEQSILMTSGQGTKPGPRNPVDAVLCKPFDIGRLRKVTTRLLEKREALAA
jgi:DNA-binding response OmpR family regulator